jgi:hypothetical protein
MPTTWPEVFFPTVCAYPTPTARYLFWAGESYLISISTICPKCSKKSQHIVITYISHSNITVIY